MRLTEKQFAKIEHLMPTPRRKPEVSNYDFLCALLYIIENGCKWRALPNEYGNWHTIYVRFNRWCKSGVIDRIFETLQEENIIKNSEEKIYIVYRKPCKPVTTRHRRGAYEYENESE